MDSWAGLSATMGTPTTILGQVPPLCLVSVAGSRVLHSGPADSERV